MRTLLNIGRFVLGLVTGFWLISAGMTVANAIGDSSLTRWAWTMLAAVMPLIPYAGYRYLTARVERLSAPN